MKRHRFAGRPVATAAKTFTLIELLVVIAIIAVLASMLMASLSRALERSKSIDCQNRIGQTMRGFFLYADDNGGHMLVCTPSGISGNAKLGYWPSMLTGRHPKATRYIDPSVTFCPTTFPPENLNAINESVTAFGSYGMLHGGMTNTIRAGIIGPGSYLDIGGTHTWVSGRMRRPSRTFLLTDTVCSLSPRGHQCWEWNAGCLAGSSTSRAAPQTRHLGRASCAFADGHTAALTALGMVRTASFAQKVFDANLVQVLDLSAPTGEYPY